MTYQIKIQQFEGPFDLLLYFIERDELDIHDIPISKITEDFLDYIRSMEEMDIDLASEFILVAATLVRIKSKMLLPRVEVDEFGEEIDPREDLIKRLLEYKRFKEVLDGFQELEAVQLSKLRRGNVESELKLLGQRAVLESELESVSLYKLFEVFTGLMRDSDLRGKRVVHKVYRYPYTSEGQAAAIKKRLTKTPKILFSDLFTTMENRIEAIFTFLAILEMINLNELKIINGNANNEFWIVSEN